MTSAPLFRSRPGGHEIRPASQPEATKVNDFIYLSEGLSNAYLIVTPEGRVVVNTGMGFEAPVHKRNFDAVDDGPLRYILFTQGHVDHVGGTDLFREAGTKVIAHANNQAHQADDARIGSFRAVRSGFAFAEAISQAWTYIQENAGGAIPARVFFAHFLFVLAAWTLVIKFAFPVAWAVAEGAPLLRYVWWDFWWVAHLTLGRALLLRPPWLLPFALAVAVVEVAIVVTKFVLFLSAPEWTIWTTNWFINKIFVLGVFVPMLVHMALASGEYRARRPTEVAAPEPRAARG